MHAVLGTTRTAFSEKAIRFAGATLRNAHQRSRYLSSPPCAASDSARTINLAGSILDREWMLCRPDAKILQMKQIQPSGSAGGSFHLVQDDLLHPIMGGNKLRKLDALMPALLGRGITDVVTCGGLQSAHTAAVASACAEHGLKAHLLVRGELPAVPTGYHLLARMFGHVIYISRNEYADREAMFTRYVSDLEAHDGDIRTRQVHVLREGAAEPLALLGQIRLVNFLATSGWIPKDEPSTMVVDSGTGVTATGMAIGMALLELPCTVLGVMLAAPLKYYTLQAADLVAAFEAGGFVSEGTLGVDLPLKWAERVRPRTFGKVYDDDIKACIKVARDHGILLDPIYSLAAWEAAIQLVAEPAQESRILMLHTGGALGLHGVAQRLPMAF